jgi:hypothetical protein
MCLQGPHKKWHYSNFSSGSRKMWLMIHGSLSRLQDLLHLKTNPSKWFFYKKNHTTNTTHTLSPKGKHLRYPSEIPNCDVCSILEDFQHLLLECKMFDAERVRLNYVLQQNSLNIDRLQSILAEPGSDALWSGFEE